VIRNFVNQNRSDRDRIAALEKRVEELSATLGIPTAAKPARRLTRAQAKSAIKRYFAARGEETVYPSDVASELNVDYDLAAQVISELEAEGEIEKA
jgi:DNA-binding MarR family transcriptional regulator